MAYPCGAELNESEAAQKKFKWTAALAGFSGLVLFVSRLYYAPKYLYYFDNANFAFALERFDPAAHQPQPPGDPVFVALLHIINGWVHDPNRSLTIAGLFGSAFALTLLWLWTNRMFGSAPAWAATALFILHPVFWLAGVANPVRVFLAMAATGAGLALWYALTAGAPARMFLYAGAVIGLLTGFRPETLVLLTPSYLAVAIYRKLPFRGVLAGTFVLLAATATWLLPMAVRMGGIAPMVHVFSEYVRSRSVGYTAAYGASTEHSFTTIRRAVIWPMGMAVVWLWALPFTWKRFIAFWDKPRVLLILAILIPAFLFHAFIHLRDIDQTLISVPLICLVGGVALASLPSRKATILASLFCLCASWWSFRAPFFSDLRGASARAIRYVEDWSGPTYNALNQVRSKPGTILVWHSEIVPYRNVSYYYRDLPILVISEEQPRYWIQSGHDGPAPADAAGNIPVNSSIKHIVLGLSYVDAAAAEHQLPGAYRVGPLICIDVHPDEYIRFESINLHIRH